MRPVITGTSRADRRSAEALRDKLEGRLKPVRIVHELVRLAVTGAMAALDSAGVGIPVGKTDTGLFIGLDVSIEDIKDDYFRNILREGPEGAGPLLFPFTSPNALAALISIVADIRGECITMPIHHSGADVLIYAAECIEVEYVSAALVGCLTLNEDRAPAGGNRYKAEFYYMEDMKRAASRGAEILETALMSELFRRRLQAL